MFVPIANTPRPYEWGSKTAIAEVLDREPSGEPEAELWLGAHPGSPSRILTPEHTGGARDLAEWIAEDPTSALGDFAEGGRLPFLLKLLAAAAPLSLQAHPTLEQAREGFARENEAGVPLTAPDRNYKDAFPKPEVIVALSDSFDALCGFRPVSEFRAMVGALLAAAEAVSDADATAASGAAALENLRERAGGEGATESDTLRSLVEWLSRGGPEVDRLVTAVVSAAVTAGGFDAAFDTVRMLADRYPGDPGIVISLLLNRVTLARGEALYLPAGNIHAYLAGLGVELMAASDNVLRGGLTPKHVDVPELLRVLDFTPVDIPYLRPEIPQQGVRVFRPDVPDFVLVQVEGSATAGDRLVPLGGPAIAICTEGSVSISGRSSTTLAQGETLFITPDEGDLTVAGAGELFVATTG